MGARGTTNLYWGRRRSKGEERTDWKNITTEGEKRKSTDIRRGLVTSPFLNEVALAKFRKKDRSLEKEREKKKMVALLLGQLMAEDLI